MNRDWMLDAACRDHPDPDLFFPSANGVSATKQLVAAQQICRTCPVAALCEQYRQETGSAFGVWGGSIIRTHVYGQTGRTRLMHGTDAMCRRHQRLGETPCHACRVAARRARKQRA